MSKQAPEEKVLAQQLGGEGNHTYPDFDAMWLKIEADRQQEQAPAVVKRTKRTGFLHGRRLAFCHQLLLLLLQPQCWHPCRGNGILHLVRD